VSRYKNPRVLFDFAARRVDRRVLSSSGEVREEADLALALL
jgi:hypothetical protein